MIYASQHSRLYLAQPAVADGSPRFDYVLRTITDQPEFRYESVAQLERFASAATIANAKHPNLIVVLDAVLESTTPFIIMPRLVGTTLSQWLMNTKLQPLPVVLWAVRQAAQGLRALHQSSWIHGDVKPDNLFVSPQGHVTLLDLGFARQIGTAPKSTFSGTPKYAAPELLDEATATTAAADVFSLGKVLLELLTWTAPTVLNQTALEPIADLIAELIADDPAARPTVSEIIARLRLLEIENLGAHIQPHSTSRCRAA